MIAIHPHFLVDESGRPLAVQVPVDEFRSLVFAAYEAGKIGEGEAATMLGVTRPAFYALAAAAGVSTCSYTPESVEAELANRLTIVDQGPGDEPAGRRAGRFGGPAIPGIRIQPFTRDEANQRDAT